MAQGGVTEGDMQAAMKLLCGAPVHYSTDSEVEAAVALLLDWVRGLGSSGTLPGAVTVARSTGGYLPPRYLDRLSPLAERLAEALGAEPPTWVPCSSCVDLNLVNDLGVDAEVFWLDEFWLGEDGHDPLVPITGLGKGARHTMDSFSGHTFLVRSGGGSELVPEASETWRMVSVTFGEAWQEVRLSMSPVVRAPAQRGRTARPPHPPQGEL
ncbi:unnamed protein product [Prorocentrum cordatum]|uniref:Uncharacterized protein n=1 Tax=Prorocentrum cordatum TaxID=2364126 RepID=A0ABN9VM25_9DINO|nr:unnamed protein product [Polarella glacialis]